jgi:hypothetical protein
MNATKAKPMIPARFAPILFGFILSGLMSAIVSAIATARVLDRHLSGNGLGLGFQAGWSLFQPSCLSPPSPADW